MNTIDNNPPALRTPLATTREPADRWASHTIEALSHDDNETSSKPEAAAQSHSTATTPGLPIPGAYPGLSSEPHVTAEALQADAEYVKDAALNALQTAKEYVDSAGETVVGYLPPSVAAYLPGGQPEHTPSNPGSGEPTHRIRDVAQTVVPPPTSQEVENSDVASGPAAIQHSPATYLHPHSTPAANPPIGAPSVGGASVDASTKSLPGSRLDTPSSLNDTPPGVACSNGRTEHHDVHSLSTEERAHHPSGLAAATALPEASEHQLRPASANQPLNVNPREHALGQEGSPYSGVALAEGHQRSLDADEERGSGVGEKNVPTRIVGGKTEIRGEPTTAEEAKFGSGDKGKEQEHPIVTSPTTEGESAKERKERTLREELATLEGGQQEGSSAAQPSTATATRARTTLEPGEKDKPTKQPTVAEPQATQQAETTPTKTADKKEHRKSFINKLKGLGEKMHVGSKEKKGAALQHQQEGAGEIGQPPSKN